MMSEIVPQTNPEDATKAFFRALSFGLHSEVTTLLHSNSDLILKTDAHGNTPMHWAVKSGDVELMETLFKFGAHLDDQTSSESRMYPIHWAASEGKVTSIRFLLSNKCDINVQDSNGCTPLIVAAQHNMINAVIFLIKNGADFDVVDCNGDTALHWAAYKGYYELVAVLTYLFPSAVDRLDKFKQTPVHLAALRGNLTVVEYLVLDCKCNTTLKDSNGSRPVDLAANKNQFKCEWFLYKSSSTNFINFLTNLGIKKILSKRIFVGLVMGVSDFELSSWAWRVVFVSNLAGSVLTTVMIGDEKMTDCNLLRLFNTIFQGLWWIMFMMCLLKSPGQAVDHETRYRFSVDRSYSTAIDIIGKLQGDEDPDTLPNLCHSCHLVKPLRSKHCKMLRHCVQKFDHFCPFVGNTVGRDNYKYFVGLLCMHSICGVLWEVTAFYYCNRVSTSWMFKLYALYAFGWLLMIFGLFHYHCNLIVSNLTTNEYMGIGKYSYLRDSIKSRFDNPFNLGTIYANVLDGLFPSSDVYYVRDEVLEALSSKRVTYSCESGACSHDHGHSHNDSSIFEDRERLLKV